MKQFLLVITLVLSQFGFLLGQSPGGVSGNLRWWLKSNAEVYENNGTNTAEDGDGVYVWGDQSTIGNDAVQSTGGNRPIYKNSTTGNDINGYPVLRFSGDQFLDGTNAPGIGDTESFNVFMVFRQSSWINGGTNDGNGSFIIDRPPPESNNLMSFKMVTGNKYFYQRRDNAGNNLGGTTSATSANTSAFVITNYFRNYGSLSEGIYLDGNLDGTNSTPNSNMAAPRIRIGRHAAIANNGMSGDFAEMIVYDDNVSAGERSRVQSYLAIKYGITLDPGTNYVRSDGTTIYNSTGSHSAYVTDIAGIGRDDNSGLNHTSSTSQNANSVVTISNPSGMGDEEFLVWGHNNGSLTVPSTSDLPSGIERKLSRIWRVAETGNVGTFTLTVDLSAVPGSKNASDLRLLVDTNGTFAGGAVLYTVSASAGSTFTFNNVNITNNDYFTIGTVDASTTPLPIELVDFNVTYENPIVVASWQTASEMNNDFFTLERAGTDLNFDEIGTIPGAGTSKSPHVYSLIDANPYEGRSYYRLKQTDFDGTVSYSPTKSMFIEESEKKIVVFPNPSKGKNIRFTWGNAPFNLSQIEVLNQQGKRIATSKIAQENLREYEVELKRRLPTGLYLVKVYFNGKEETVKLMVQ